MARPRSSRDNRMGKTWTALVNSAGSALTPIESVILSLTPTLDAFRQDMTLLRTRGQILITAQPNAITDSDIVGLGIAVLDPEAVTAVAIPNPITDAGDDRWLWHQFVCLDAVTLAVGDPNAITLNQVVEVDSKAMRKMTGGSIGRSALTLIGATADGDMGVVTAVAGLRFLIGIK